ncbi:hypothetical protein, conserved [Eimeria necatrix]|uniref:Phosphotyrosine protein phosphatase I domain-containing protein n=2 Tax=Eimeria TaxID=5800 RepID=U6MXK2_9EIME|nr:hypothetical protein, conserved [Eimeria tenella]XP_013437143.1 hypothetical protein, conserved [Eimeria necatrix]CDJ38338.1 hypothetical protein, conserved [Eimeria tenella]CDJ68676.1 hypothetical protein, conserved [Eimeria necatrix]|eukprot:XP_013229176.1 hypothetical protein, conserved [Eimeria tenella]
MVRSVLFVCLGNVNRSPTAEYILRSKLQLQTLNPKPFKVASAATGGHTEGDPAMGEMIRAARKRGVDLSPHRARQEFDLVVAMDKSNLRNLAALCPPDKRHKLKLLIRDYAPECGTEEVPDPYYEGGHLNVFDLIEKGVEGLIKKEEIVVN